MQLRIYAICWKSCVACCGDKVVAYERKYSTDISGTKYVTAWLTEGQLEDVYKDKIVVQAFL